MRILAEQLIDTLRDRGLMLATAESCTGGLLAAAITDIPGASDVFERGFVTYSNDSKMDVLGVPAFLLARHGAVSAETAEAMASGALTHSRADLAVSITGIAGPSGGTAEKPVGLVYIGLCMKNEPAQSAKHHFTGDRAEIRRQSAEAALLHLISLLD